MLTFDEFVDLIIKGQADKLKDTDYLSTYLLVPLGEAAPLNEKTALGEVIKQSNFELVERFLNREPQCLHVVNTKGQTPIYEAVAARNIEMIAILNNNGADLEHTYVERNQHKSLLCYAMEVADAATITYILKLKPDISLVPNPLLAANCAYTGAKIAPLIAAGAETNFSDSLQRTILHRAAIWGDKSAIELLCSHYHLINCLDAAGHSALDYAIHFPDPDEKNAKEILLRASGALEAKKVSATLRYDKMKLNMDNMQDNLAHSEYGKVQSAVKRQHKHKPYERKQLKRSMDSDSGSDDDRYQPQYFKSNQNITNQTNNQDQEQLFESLFKDFNF